MPKEWYVYIAQCADGSLYTGITVDVGQRAKAHNTGRGSKYIRSRGGATMRYVEAWPTNSLALRREHDIKTWTRQQKFALLGAA